jgi:hypothetical protein
MAESHQAAGGAGGKLGTASLWLGLFGLAFAAPPTAVFFLVPGFWVDGLNITSAASPVLAVGAVLSGVLARRGSKRRHALAGIWLGLATLVCLAALAARVLSLLALEE